jgi:hypothetical protein
MTPRAAAIPVPALAPVLIPEDDPSVYTGLVDEVLEVDEVAAGLGTI